LKNIIVLILILYFFISISAQQRFKLENWATDLTNTLTQDQLTYLNNKLRAYEDSTTNQIVILIISSLNDNSIEDLANEIFTYNKIGTKKNDNGVLILVSMLDKQIKIEVGYGLEARLTDAKSSSIIRNEIIPSFKQEKYFEGINKALDSILLAIQGEYISDKTDSLEDNSWIIFIIVLLLILISYKFRAYNSGYVIRGSKMRNRHWGGFGGGFSGFGTGRGFRGGGGMSGGAGAVGRW
jgi:uncharacterized protein